MNAIAKIQDKGQVTIPTKLRALAGLSKGDLVEFSLRRGKIVITPKVVIDRSKFPNADDEYTPEQRRVIDAGLDEAHDELRRGLASPAFTNIADFAAALTADAKKLQAKASRAQRR